MALLATRRTRLTSVAVAALALVGAVGWFSDGAEAQPRGTAQPPLINCDEERNAVQLPATNRLRSSNANAGNLAVSTPLTTIQTYDRRSNNFEALRAARNDCNNLRRGERSRYSIRAYNCSAEASLLLGTYSPDDRGRNFEDAYCSFGAAADLARVSNNRALRAEAEEGRAKTLLAWRQSGNTDGRYLSEAISAYEISVGRDGQANAVRQRELGLAYLQRRSDGDVGRATTQIDASYAANGTGPEIALALVTLANALGPNSAAEQQRLLANAERAASGSLSVTAALGIAQYRSARTGEQWNEARRTLDRAISYAPRPEDTAGAVNYEAEAYYYRALIDVPGSGRGGSNSWASVFRHAQTSVDKGGGEDARQLRCMAFVARGWARSENNSSSNCETGNSAQGLLLRGMYQIRAAQYTRPDRIATQAEFARWNAYLQALNEAASTFDRGIAVARQLQSPNVALPDRPDQVNVLRLLQFGRSVMAPGCSQLTTGGTRQAPTVPVDPEIISAGTGFYERYGVLDCAASQSP